MLVESFQILHKRTLNSSSFVERKSMLVDAFALLIQKERECGWDRKFLKTENFLKEKCDRFSFWRQIRTLSANKLGLQFHCFCMPLFFFQRWGNLHCRSRHLKCYFCGIRKRLTCSKSWNIDCAVYSVGYSVMWLSIHCLSKSLMSKSVLLLYLSIKLKATKRPLAYFNLQSYHFSLEQDTHSTRSSWVCTVHKSAFEHKAVHTYNILL